MGCTGSKNTTVKKNTKESTSIFIVLEEGIKYLVQSLGVSDKSAKEVAERCSKDKDGKISKDEITALEVEVKNTEKQFDSKFDEYDKDKSGFVTKEEAKKVMEEELPQFPKKHLDNLIADFANEDGKMNKKEFYLFYGNLKMRQDKLEEICNELQPDENGDIIADELEKLAIERGGLTEKQAKKMIEVADKNDDGKLNQKEFKRACKRLTGKIDED